MKVGMLLPQIGESAKDLDKLAFKTAREKEAFSID
jgi:hypothetical protein